MRILIYPFYEAYRKYPVLIDANDCIHISWICIPDIF